MYIDFYNIHMPDCIKGEISLDKLKTRLKSEVVLNDKVANCSLCNDSSTSGSKISAQCGTAETFSDFKYTQCPISSKGKYYVTYNDGHKSLQCDDIALNNAENPKENNDLQIKCTPITLSNDGETVASYVVPIDSEYSRDAQKLDFMRTLLNLVFVIIICLAIYALVPNLYRILIIDTIKKMYGSEPDSVNAILKRMGSIDIFIAVIVAVVVIYNLIIGSNPPKDTIAPKINKNNPLRESEGYNKSLFAFILIVIFTFFSHIIYTKKSDRDFLGLGNDVKYEFKHDIFEFIGEYFNSLIFGNKNGVTKNPDGTTCMGLPIPKIPSIGGIPSKAGLTCIGFLIPYIIVLFALATDNKLYWEEGVFLGNNVITRDTFYECLVFYSIWIIIPFSVGIYNYFHYMDAK
jgi:hypothetical protein